METVPCSGVGGGMGGDQEPAGPLGDRRECGVSFRVKKLLSDERAFLCSVSFSHFGETGVDSYPPPNRSKIHVILGQLDLQIRTSEYVVLFRPVLGDLGHPSVAGRGPGCTHNL